MAIIIARCAAKNSGGGQGMRLIDSDTFSTDPAGPDLSNEELLKVLGMIKPVTPVMVPHSRGIAYNCGFCGTEIAVIRDTVSADAIPKMYKYCRMCGTRIMWG